MSDFTPESATITVAEALALPELRAGHPEVVTGEAHLDRRLRWAHVVAGGRSASLLDGGELLLTTGAGWPSGGDALEQLMHDLVATDPAAFVFELGTRFAALPAPLERACADAGIPLIVLHREVRFVQITQRIHQLLLAAQSAALTARAEVHTMLTELGLNRSPVDTVIERLAETLGAPVVLEDPAGDVVAWSGSSSLSGEGSAHVLDAWADSTGLGGAAGSAKSAGPGGSTVGQGPRGPLGEGWDRVTVEAQGRRWGSLTALPGPPHAAGRRTVLELGAFALALGRLADPDGTQWLRLGSKRMFDVLLGSRFRRDDELATQLAAFGLPIENRVVLGATLRGRGDFGAHVSLERAILETALRRAVAPEGRVIIAAEDALDSHAVETGGVGGVGGGLGAGTTGGSGPRFGPGSGLGSSLGLGTGSGLPAGFDAEPGRPYEVPGHTSATATAPGMPQTGPPERPALLALISFPVDDPRLGSGGPGDPAPLLASRLAKELDMLLPSTTPAGWRAHLALGAAGRGLRSLITSLERVRAADRLSPIAETGRVTVQQAERQALAYLVRGLAATPEMQEFVAATIGPLIEDDALRGPGHSGDLVRVLGHYLEHPTNRSLAAQRARMSRTVFYQRLARIEELLSVNLADGAVIATLTVALLAGARPAR